MTFYMGLFIFTYAVHNRVRLVRLAAVLIYGVGGLDETTPPRPPRVSSGPHKKRSDDTLEVGDLGLALTRSSTLGSAGAVVESGRRGWGWLEKVKEWVHRARDHPVAYFTKGDDPIHDLNSVIHYVLMNEPSSRLVIVHCYDNEDDIPSSLEANCITLDHVYPNLRLDLVFVKAKFSVEIVSSIAKRIGVHRNMCMASCKWNHLEDLSTLKGVRLVLL
ncbi:hypothetical protein HDU67_006382 [Dinochytrium kinnereticum]|nr:hypothetical protein HDU67_006382 [Dinochytrium kinnereticum]